MRGDVMTEEVIHIREGETFIRLGQALKLVGAVGSGVDAKIVISEGQVTVNGEIEVRRGRKLYPGDIAVFEDYQIKVME